MSIGNDETTTKRTCRRRERGKAGNSGFSTEGKVADEGEKDNIETVLSGIEIMLHGNEVFQKNFRIITFGTSMDFLPKIVLTTAIMKSIAIVNDIVTRTITMGNRIFMRIDLTKDIGTKVRLKRGRAEGSEKIVRGKRGNEIFHNQRIAINRITIMNDTANTSLRKGIATDKTFAKQPKTKRATIAQTKLTIKITLVMTGRGSGQTDKMLLKSGNADTIKKPRPKLLDLGSKSKAGNELIMIVNTKRLQPENELLLLGREKTFRIEFKGRNTVGQRVKPFRLRRKRTEYSPRRSRKRNIKTTKESPTKNEK